VRTWRVGPPVWASRLLWTSIGGKESSPILLRTQARGTAAVVARYGLQQLLGLV
jgi:hypothetical protein